MPLYCGGQTAAHPCVLAYLSKPPAAALFESVSAVVLLVVF